MLNSLAKVPRKKEQESEREGDREREKKITFVTANI